MTGWGIFGRKPEPPQKVITGRFEIERDGKVAYLEYTIAGQVLGLTIPRFQINCVVWAWRHLWLKPPFAMRSRTS